MGNIKKFNEFVNEKKSSKKDNKKELPKKGTPDWHQLQIAKKTLKMNDVGADIMGGMTKKEARELLKKYDIKINENVENFDTKFQAIASQIEKGFTNGEEPEEWELEVNLKDWIKLDDDDIDYIAAQIRSGNTEGNDPIDWKIEFGGDSFDIEEEEENFTENDLSDNQIRVINILVNDYGFSDYKATELVCKHEDIVEVNDNMEDAALSIIEQEDQGYDTEEEEEMTRKDVANQIDVDESDFEDSADLGDMADSIIQNHNIYESTLDEVKDLFDTYVDNNDVSRFFNPTLGKDFEYDKFDTMYKEVIEYYPTFEEDFGYLDEFGSDMFNSILKSMIKKFLNR